MKRFFSALLTLAMALVFAAPAFAEDGDFTIETQGQFVRIVRYNGPGGVVVIPDGVTTIASEAFKGCTTVTSVTFPDSVTGIGKNAFEGCTGLTNIVIPDSVKNIGWRAFQDCTGLTSVVLSNNLKVIENYTFMGCTSLKEVVFPESVHNITYGAFENCVGLTSLTIPGTIREIGSRAFYGCSGLTGITISDGVEKLNDSAFQNCAGLTDAIIPNSVTEISEGTFSGCTKLTRVTLSNKQTALRKGVFKGCISLADVTFPNSITEIGTDVFLNCTSLRDIHYTGNATQWAKIVVMSGNKALEDAAIHYNSTGPAAQPEQPEQPVGQPAAAMPTNDSLTVNGAQANPTAYKIDGSNYFKLRDVAALLNGSKGQFSVEYDSALQSITITTGEGYKKLSSDLQPAPAGDKQADPSNNTVYIDGVRADLTVYKIDGSNYFKLRDLGEKLNFRVDWSLEIGMTIDTN